MVLDDTGKMCSTSGVPGAHLVHGIVAETTIFWVRLLAHHRKKARPRVQSDRGRFYPIGKKSLFKPDCVQGAII